MGGVVTNKPRIFRDDPDETEGRALYRAHAQATARAQLAYEQRSVRLSSEGDRA